MYIFVNQGLDMSAGKIAAQAGHAAAEALRFTDPSVTRFDWEQACYPDDYLNVHRLDLLEAWYRGGHYAKYVMAARDSEHMRSIDRYLDARGFEVAFIIDEGHTEIDAIQPTALGVPLVDKDDPHTAATFSSFDLFREPRPSEYADKETRAYDLGLEDGRVIERADISHVPSLALGCNGRHDCDQCEGHREYCDGAECQK